MEEITQALIGLVVAVLCFLIKSVMNYINVKANSIKNEANRNLAVESVKQLDDLVYKTVSAIEVSIGSAMKEALEDGRITKEEILALKDKARESVLSGLKVDFLEACSEIVGNVDEYVDSQIENALADIKNKLK